ncbi:MAG: hypothetical protein ABJZ55_05570 [Fuerstiella sp.]
MRFMQVLIFTAFLNATVTFGMNPQDPAEQPPTLPLVFQDDFESGSDKWKTTDPAAWRLQKSDENQVFGLNKRKSNYEPEHRSPYNIAIIKDLKLSDFDIRFRVKSTKDTGNHRDCCVFFCHQNSSQFYYVHMGAKPDPHSGQIMIVNNSPRKAMTENTRKTPWDDNWHNVRLTRESKTGLIKVYFDDFTKPHMQVTDKTFTEGGIGIGSFDDMNDFDDVKVYGK